MRFNVVVTIQRGRHEAVTYSFNREPVRPGKVDKVFADAVADVVNHITRNGQHEHNGYYYGDDIFVAVSDGVTAQVVKVRA
jgi:hypothetical protein